MTSPVDIEAAAGSPNGISSIGAWVDGVKVASSTTTTLSKSDALATGTHRLAIIATDKTGAQVKVVANFTVGTGGGGGGGSCTTGSSTFNVIICTPADGSTVTSPVQITVAAGSPNGIKNIGAWIDHVKLTSTTSSTLTTSDSLPAGTHRLGVIATDNTGAQVQAVSNFTVGGGGGGGGCTTGSTTLNINICSPVDGSTVTSPVDVEAAAGGPNGISSISAWLDGVKVASTTTSPLSKSLTVADGTHRLAIIASDSTGASTKSVVNFTAGTGGGGGGGSCSADGVSTSASILTYKGNNSRIGTYAAETTLTPANVNPTTFGREFRFPVDGNVFAQPLYVPNVSIGSGAHNVIILATEHDSLYAYDAEDTGPSLFWKDSFIDAANNITTVPACSGCGRTSLGPEVGITGTPVIDPATNTIYVVAMVDDNGTLKFYLHAVDLITGAEKFGGPVRVTATVNGSGEGGDGNGHITLDEATANQRAGLMLLNGTVYISFAAFSDIHPYHGWVLGYDASTLQQVSVLNVTPNSSAGGIWGGGGGPSADACGNIYFTTGNGHYNGSTEWGQTFLKTTPSGSTLSVVDWFTPFDFSSINSSDLDVGSGAMAQLPDQGGTFTHLIAMGAKTGKIYLINRDQMGRLGSTSDHILQEIDLNPPSVTSGTRPRMYSSPAYWNGWLYFAPANHTALAYALNNAQLTQTSHTAHSFGARGGIPVVSANGTTNGIVWIAENNPTTGREELHAYDATNLATELWNSEMNVTRDAMTSPFSFETPIVANGRVYVPSKGYVNVFGLLP